MEQVVYCAQIRYSMNKTQTRILNKALSEISDSLQYDEDRMSQMWFFRSTSRQKNWYIGNLKRRRAAVAILLDYVNCTKSEGGYVILKARIPVVGGIAPVNVANTKGRRVKGEKIAVK